MGTEDEGSSSLAVAPPPVARRVCVVGVGGELAVDPPVNIGDSVETLRQRVAHLLAVPPGAIDLTYGDSKLQDGQRLEDVTGDETDVMITAVRMPCQVPPSEYEQHILPGTSGLLPPDEPPSPLFVREPHAFVVVARELQFPAPRGININMLPFVMGDASSLPDEYRQYWPLIQKCRLQEDDINKVGFLTVHESAVKAGETQRRPGIHTEMPGTGLCEGGRGWELLSWGGRRAGVCHGGIFMASNVDCSCRVWDCTVDPLAIGELGSLEHLREILASSGEKYRPTGELVWQQDEKYPARPLEAGELVWITDTTPHESLPVAQDTHRQYFRLVTHKVTVWYEKHSTKNRLGIVPDPLITRVVDYDKFVDARLRAAGAAAQS